MFIGYHTCIQVMQDEMQQHIGDANAILRDVQFKAAALEKTSRALLNHSMYYPLRTYAWCV